MERIQALIDKLYEQRQQNCPPAQMLLTVQILQSELVRLQQKNGVLGSSKVAVTLPLQMNFPEERTRPAPVENIPAAAAVVRRDEPAPAHIRFAPPQPAIETV